jgi:hypothetical protein
MGAEVAGGDGVRIDPPQGAGGLAHVGGVEEHKKVRVEATNQAGEVFRGGGGVQAAPVGMAEGAGEDGPEGVVAVAGIADAEEEVHEEVSRSQESAFRMIGQGAGIRPLAKTYSYCNNYSIGFGLRWT